MYKYLLSALILLAVALFGAVLIDNALSKAVERGRSEVKQQYTSTYVEGLKSSLEASNRLLENANNARKELENAKDSIISARNADIKRLQLRSTRAEAAASRSAADVSACKSALSAAELPREDAEFLTGEAARADFILKERDYYYERYEDARSQLEAYTRTINGRYGEAANAVPVP